MLIDILVSVEAKQQQGSSGSPASVDLLSPSTNSLSSAKEPSAVFREGRSFSASAVLHSASASTKVLPKKSPKLWPRRNAYVTPLNGPAPLYGEWPLVGSDPLVEFGKLHDYFGQEVKKLREEWLKSRQTPDDSSDGDLIDLG